VIPPIGSHWRTEPIDPAEQDVIVVLGIDPNYDPPGVLVRCVAGRNLGALELWPPSIFDDIGVTRLEE
jgi:hypothetical protein